MRSTEEEGEKIEFGEERCLEIVGEKDRRSVTQMLWVAEETGKRSSLVYTKLGTVNLVRFSSTSKGGALEVEENKEIELLMPSSEGGEGSDGRWKGSSNWSTCAGKLSLPFPSLLHYPIFTTRLTMTSHSRRHPPRPSNEFDSDPIILLTPLPPSSLFTAPLNPLSLSHIHSPISLTLRVALTRYKWEWCETKKVEFERRCESFRSRSPRWWRERVRVWIYL